MVGPDMTGPDVEQRLRDLLTDERLAVRNPAGAIEAIHVGVRRRRRVRLAGASGAVAAVVVLAVVVGPVVLHRPARVTHGDVSSEIRAVWQPTPFTFLPPAMTAPAAMAVSGGLVWVAGPAKDPSAGDVLARVDASSRHVTTMETGIVSDMAATPRHLWVAMHDTTGSTSRCTLQLRETSHGEIVSTYSLPCDATNGTAPVVTANGAHAWVATDDGHRTHVRLYTVGSSAPPGETVLPGRLAGPHLLAIGGTSVYVVTLTAGEGAWLHRLSATSLGSLGSIAAPGARLMAYGDDQLYVADGSGVVSYPSDLSGRSGFAIGHVTTLTTGAGMVWCDPGGGTYRGLDPRTARVVGVTKLPANPGGLLRADGTVLWDVEPAPQVGVRSAEPAG